jgi:iron(II)-dependent oxidoreductase
LEEQALALEDTRARSLALVSELGETDLSRVVDPLLSPLLWDLGHIANFEQRWLLDEASSELDTLYNPFEQPRDQRGDLPILHSDDCFKYMAAVREHVNENFSELDPYLVELVIQHEGQHNETMLQLLRQIDGYTPPAELLGLYVAPSTSPQHLKLRETAARAFRPAASAASADWVAFPSASYAIGSAPSDEQQLVYDNEMNEHEVHLESFEIATHPVSNAEFREWIELGGYERAEWWSAEGRAWLAESGAQMPLGWARDGNDFVETGFGSPRELIGSAPVCHVSWFEADAYARAHGARLPNEYEWEVAASYDARDVTGSPRRRNAWGDHAWTPGAANLDQLAFGTVASGASDHGFGLIDIGGQVWEWTSSEFSAYPGFKPFAYQDYSRPFFDSGYRVLRGGSWATRARTVDNRFRNWDLPQRRQIFAGLRIARSVA